MVYHLNMGTEKPNLKNQSLAFRLANYSVLVGWVIIFFLPNWELGNKIILYGVFVIMALFYCYYLYLTSQQKVKSEWGKPSFFRMKGVLAIMDNPNAALASWMHILAFDLVIAYFIRIEGANLGIEHWKLLPCLFMTLMFGPIGLLMFLVLTLF